MRLIAKDPALWEPLVKKGLLTFAPCTDAEQEQFQRMAEAGETLPDDIVDLDEEQSYGRLLPADLTDADEQKLIDYMKLQTLRSILHWVTFFGVVLIFLLVIGAASAAR